MNSSKDIKKELLNQNFTEVECRECHGEGTYEVGPHCFRPASDCCGGCYKEVKCNVCDGTGHIDIDEDDSEMHDAYLMWCSLKYRIYKFELLAEAVRQEAPHTIVPELALLEYDIIRHKVLVERIEQDLNDMAEAKAPEDATDDEPDYEY